MPRICRYFFQAILCCFLPHFLCAENLVKDSVVAVANENDRESVSLAKYYLARRGIAEGNLILLKTSLEEEISWEEFVNTIFNPLKKRLLEGGWIEGTWLNEKDTYGRERLVSLGHHVEFLVLCKGIPIKIKGNPEFKEDRRVKNVRNEVRSSNACVDSELSLLVQGNYPLVGFVSNPLYRQDRVGPLFLEEVVRVARIDGPSFGAAMALIDNAILAEKNGLKGRAYIDLGGPHPKGDDWLKKTIKEVQKLDFDYQVNEKSELFGETERFDAPVLYFGWWAGNLSGSFLKPDFQFPPGAIAIHIYSYSAATIRSFSHNWVGPLVGKGVTVTAGNVYEPYLDFTHRPYLLLESLASGKSLGEASYYSIPVLSWQSLVVGDPLFRPFKVSLQDQVENLSPGLKGLDVYVAIRELNYLVQSGDRKNASIKLKKYLAENQSFPLIEAAIRLQHEWGNSKEVLKLLKTIFAIQEFTDEQMLIALEMARFLSDYYQRSAIKLYQKILSSKVIKPKQELDILPESIFLARKAGETRIANLWNERWHELTAKPKAQSQEPEGLN